MMFTPDALSPRDRLAGAHRRGVAKIDRVRIPLYGLPPSWVGDRATGYTCFETGVTRDDHGVTAEMHETVELVHERGVSRLCVQSTDVPLSIDDGEMLSQLGMDGTCGLLTIEVDGRPVAFASARAGDAVVARWVGYEATVTVRAECWPMAFGLQLARVHELTPYHEGRLRLLSARSSFDLGR